MTNLPIPAVPSGSVSRPPISNTPMDKANERASGDAFRKLVDDHGADDQSGHRGSSLNEAEERPAADQAPLMLRIGQGLNGRRNEFSNNDNWSAENSSNAHGDGKEQTTLDQPVTIADDPTEAEPAAFSAEKKHLGDCSPSLASEAIAVMSGPLNASTVESDASLGLAARSARLRQATALQQPNIVNGTAQSQPDQTGAEGGLALSIVGSLGREGKRSSTANMSKSSALERLDAGAGALAKTDQTAAPAAHPAALTTTTVRPADNHAAADVAVTRPVGNRPKADPDKLADERRFADVRENATANGSRNVGTDGPVAFQLAASKGPNSASAPTPAAAALEHAGTALSRAIGEQFTVSHIRQFNGGNTKVMKLQLQPAHLGQLDIVLKGENGKLSVEIQTSNADAHHILTREKVSLRTALDEANLNVDSLSIEAFRDRRIANASVAQANSSMNETGHGSGERFDGQRTGSDTGQHRSRNSSASFGNDRANGQPGNDSDSSGRTPISRGDAGIRI